MNKEMTPEEFKAERDEGNRKAKQFGQLLGVSERAVFYYEHGQRKIPKPIQLLVLLYKKHAVVD
jgi:DNA-binding transcriptional regulator YiaG